MGEGWIKLHRKAKEHWLYQKKPYDEWHAWNDILLLVNHKQNKFLHGNLILTVEAGQAVTSLRKLGERWGWGQGKVKRFLDLLVSDAMLDIRCDTTKTLVTVANWAFYQGDDENTEHDRNTNGTRTVTNKNVKNTTTTARDSWLDDWHTNIGMVNPMVADRLGEYTTAFAEGVIELAIREAVEASTPTNDTRTPRYVFRVLDRWQKAGLKTVDDVKRNLDEWHWRNGQRSDTPEAPEKPTQRWTTKIIDGEEIAVLEEA